VDDQLDSKVGESQKSVIGPDSLSQLLKKPALATRSIQAELIRVAFTLSRRDDS
jgi:hypothetical protein